MTNTFLTNPTLFEGHRYCWWHKLLFDELFHTGFILYCRPGVLPDKIDTRACTKVTWLYSN